jgi:diguanylate cyclase (GGDEF)-like protein/PAS domain S-box-containing protein
MRPSSGLSSTYSKLSRLLFSSLLFAVVACSVMASLILDWRRTETTVHSMARERGAALFQLVELARDWNARHGGVYVPVSEVTTPNPFLEHSRRDLVTQDGVALTMINPAFMTRQMAEIANQADGVKLHITSLKPIRPANAPDAWEAEALRRFEGGVSEVVELIPGPVPVHRYMAPLKVKKACMTCHEKQGYSLGQIRGGISITLPAAHLLEIRDTEIVRAGVVHGLVLLVVLVLLHLLLAQTRSHVVTLERLTAEQDQMIAERTRSLLIANEDLARQVVDRELAAAVFRNAAEAIIITDEKGIIVQVNPAFSQITGYDSGEVLGKPASMLKSGRHSQEFFAGMWQGLKREGRWQGEVWNRRKSGELFVVWLSITQIVSAAQPVRLVATLTDITRRKELEDELRHQAYHDPLTDLPNRALFADRLRVAILQAQRHGRSFALCLIDLDYFKAVNDTLGHAAGDDLLVETAHRLGLSVRAVDTIARLGGDEFAAVLTEVGSRAEVEEIASRIVGDLARPFELKAGTANISCSIGIAIFPEHGADLESLQHNADAALYEVKESTRNAYRICTNGDAG